MTRGPPAPAAPARGQAGLVLLPDVEAPRARAELVHPALRRAQGAHVRARRVGPQVRRAHPAAHHRLDRPRRLRVGRHPVRAAPRRPQGGRLHDALRPGVGRLRRVRSVLHGHGRRRSTRCWPASAWPAPEPTEPPWPTSPRSATTSIGSTGSSSRSAAAPTRRSSPGSPTTRSGPTVRWPSPRCRRRSPASSATTAPRSADEWGLRWHRGRSPTRWTEAAYRRNDGDRCFHCKDALMDALAPLRRGRGRDRRARREPRRPRRPPARPAGGRRARARSSRSSTPASPRPMVRAAVAPARAAHLGQAGGGLPRLAGPLRHPGHRRRARRRSSGPRPRCARSGSTSCGCATTATWPASRCPSTRWTGCSRPRAEVVDAVRAAGYRYVTLDLEGLRSGNLNQALG